MKKQPIMIKNEGYPIDIFSVEFRGREFIVAVL
jgi:hypothetical protein